MQAPPIVLLQFDSRQGAAALEDVRQAVLRVLGPLDLPQRCVHAVETVLEEWLSNVARHGGAGPRGARVQLALRLLPDQVELRFEDGEQAFDPLAQPAPVRPASLEQAQPGGLGLAMMRRVTRSLHYERVGQLNVLTACIDRAPAAPQGLRGAAHPST